MGQQPPPPPFETTALLSPAAVEMDIDLDDLPMVTLTNSYSLASPSFAIKDDAAKPLHVRGAGEEEPEPQWRDELARQMTITVPVIFTFMLEYLPGLVCITLVGHIDSPLTKEYVDAATISTMFTNVSALSIGFGLSSALDTLCSQAYGAGRRMKIGLYLQTSMLVVFGVCLVPIFLLNWHTEWFLLRFGQDPEVARLAGEFSKYTVFGAPFLFIYEMLRKVLQAQNVVRPLVVFIVVANFVHVFGGYYLTYHTSMGFYGAALSRTLGYAVLPLCMVPYFLWTRNYRQWWPGWDLKAAWRLVGIFLHLGVPGMLMMAMQWWAYEILALLAGVLPDGVVSISAHAVLMNVAGSLYTVYNGMSVAGNVIVGNALGANLPKRARFASWLLFVMSVGMSFLIALLVFFCRADIPKLVINDPVAIQRASEVLIVMVPYEIVDAANCAMQGIYRGTGRQQMAATTNGIAFYVFGIPVAALLAFVFHWDVEGLWIGFATGITVALVIFAYVLWHADWQQMADEAQARTAHH